jgi:hypothetical protein
MEQFQWLVDCGAPGLDLVSLLCGWPITARAALGNPIFSISRELAAHLDAEAGSPADLTDLYTHMPGSHMFFLGNQRLLDDKIRDILDLMGFTSSILVATYKGRKGNTTAAAIDIHSAGLVAPTFCP